MIAAIAIIVTIAAKHTTAMIFIELRPSASALSDMKRNDAFSEWVALSIINHQT
jgi:hypothetical protein